MVTQPKVLIADEPTGNLDTKRSHEIMQLISEFNQQGITVIMVTHEEDMAAYAKRIIRLRDGMIEKDESNAI
jgi:putative ABC transport system ATP-binding protein